MRIVVAVLVVLAGCAEPASVMVHRPGDARADAAVTKLWAGEIHRTARDGDWILTRSYYAMADVIASTSMTEQLSHASIYDHEHDTVIESVGTGVREIPLAQLVDRNHYVIVVRPNGLTAAEQAAALARARTKVGAAFDKAGMIGVHDDPDKFYCSELVWWATFGDAPHPRVIEPASLIDHGEIIYWSGTRTDPQIMRIALDHADRGAEQR
jgi:hypothetical protein